jgi:hypothetical protein
MAGPERRLIESYLIPEGGRQLFCRPYNRVGYYGSAETIEASRAERDGMITELASSRFLWCSRRIQHRDGRHICQGLISGQLVPFPAAGGDGSC